MVINITPLLEGKLSEIIKSLQELDKKHPDSYLGHEVKDVGYYEACWVSEFYLEVPNEK